MNIDTFLKIGHSHTICQDYILSGDDPCPYIILADGCSGAENSDIGARILCYSALNYLSEHQSDLAIINPTIMGRVIIVNAERILKNIRINIDCLDSTLIIAYKYNKDYYVYMYGDGVLYIINPEGYTRSFRRYYKPNAPAYLRYMIDGYQKYLDANIASFLEVSGICDQVESNVMNPFFHKFHNGDIKTLIVASDGIESFMFNDQVIYKTMYNHLRHVVLNDSPKGSITEMPKIIENTVIPSKKELNFEDVIKEMSDFKLTKGIFLQRRVKKVMKEYLKKGFINDDDLSIGCFHEE